MALWPGDYSPLVGIQKSLAHATPAVLRHLPGVTPLPHPADRTPDPLPGVCRVAMRGSWGRSDSGTLGHSAWRRVVGYVGTAAGARRWPLAMRWSVRYWHKRTLVGPMATAGFGHDLPFAKHPVTGSFMRIADISRGRQFDRKATRAGVQPRCGGRPNFGRSCRWVLRPAMTAVHWLPVVGRESCPKGSLLVS